MAARVKELLDELASVLAEMGALEDEGAAEEVVEGEGVEAASADRSVVEAVEARQVAYDALVAKADRIKSAIAKEEAREAKKAELLKVLNRAAPVEATEMAKPRIEPISFRGRLRAFDDVQTAHRCGQWLKAHFGDANAR
jgi:hypothetical protein